MDQQTATLIACIAENLPEMDRNLMQGLIENPKGLQNILKEALCPSEITTKSRFKKDDMIYFTVTSNGKSGKEWIKHFESKGIKVSDCAKQLLLSKDFKPSKKDTASQIAVIKGEFFSDSDRITSKIREEADHHKMTNPNAEVACLIRDMFNDEEIKARGLYWIVAMHEPIKDSVGDPSLLCTDRDADGLWLNTYYVEPGRRWSREYGFAFVVSQVSA